MSNSLLTLVFTCVTLVLVRRAFTLKLNDLEAIKDLFTTFFESSLAECVDVIRQDIITESTQVEKFEGSIDNLIPDMDAADRKAMAQKLTGIIAKNLVV